MRKSRVYIATIIILGCIAGQISADVPYMVNYQGRLTDSGGTPLDTTVDLAFCLFANETSTMPLWTETHPSVTVVDGMFELILGSITPIPQSVFDGNIRWLSIEIDGGPPPTSRIPIVSVAYAMRAGHADTAAYALAAPGGGGSGWEVSGNYVRLETTPDSVGIGVLTPSAKLDVNGDVRFSSRLTVGGSHTNTGNNASITGGSFNTITGDYSVIGGGNSNRTEQIYSTVSGGAVNRATQTGAAVGGGSNNTADGVYATVGGGRNNRVGGSYSVIAGGGGQAVADSNTVDGSCSAIGGGRGNAIAGNNNTIAGGEDHAIVGLYSAVLGGFADTINAGYSYLFGIGSKLSLDSTFMVDMPHIHFGDATTGYEFPASDGAADQILATNGSGHLGWTDPSSGSVSNWSVLDSVLYTNNKWGIARGGAENVLYGDSAWTMVNLGIKSKTGLATETRGFATIGGGYFNEAEGTMSTIGGGGSNDATGLRSTVAGGYLNRANGPSSFIGGGYSNQADGSGSTIGGGYQNHAAGLYSSILGGYRDTITASASYSYLFGHNSKLTQSETFMVDMPHIWFGDEATGYEFPDSRGSKDQIMAQDASGQLIWVDRFSLTEGDNRFVNESGDEMNGNLTFDNADDGVIEASIDLGNDYANVELFNSDSLTTKIYGDRYGGVYLYSDTGGIRIISDASPGGGIIKLFDNDAVEAIRLDAGSSTPNSAVILPGNAIDDEEILNEPGIASAVSTTSTMLPGLVIDLITGTINIPAAGYIHVQAKCYVRMYGTTGTNNAWLQIDETSGGIVTSPNCVMVGTDTSLSTGSLRIPVYVDRVYFKASPGAYTFRLEGEASGNIYVYNKTLTMTYYPTSYSSVKTIVADPGDHPEAKPVQVALDDEQGSTKTAYEIDLRYYELRAKEARARALEAELELERARQRSSRDESGR